MKHTEIPQGVCSQKIDFELDGDVVKNVSFTGGCNGNLKGISALVEGKTVSEIASLLEGITCGLKETSCPDQLAKALKRAFAEEQGNKA